MTNLQLYLNLFTVLNVFLSSNAGYIGTPQSTGTLRAVLRNSLELRCEYTDGDGQFSGWYRDDQPVSLEKPGHYIVKSNSKESILTIKIFVTNDSYIKKWSVKTNKERYEYPTQCQFGPIPLIPSPQSIETDKIEEKMDSSYQSVRRTEDESISFKCNIAPSQPTQNKANGIQWTYSTNIDSFTQLPEGVRIVSEDQISIDQVKKAHRGYYRCTLNDVPFTVLLRVKDRLAALWPFLGIVGILLVLVIVILIFEKRQKSTRKSATTDEDENDHANDPLVRSSNKSSDNENKKRAVKT